MKVKKKDKKQQPQKITHSDSNGIDTFRIKQKRIELLPLAAG